MPYKSPDRYKSHNYSNMIKFTNGAKLLMNDTPWNIKDAIARAKSYVAQGVTTVVVLLTKEELTFLYGRFDRVFTLFRIYEHEGLKVIHYPIQDYDVPDNLRTFDGLINSIRTEISEKHNVLVHCHGGHGRTGVVVVSTLVKSGLTPEAAIVMGRKARPVLESKSQINFITEYYKYLHSFRADISYN